MTALPDITTRPPASPDKPATLAQSRATPITSGQRAAIERHVDPETGSRYWIERVRQLGVDVGELRTHEELCEAFGPMDEDAMRERPVFDFVPRPIVNRAQGLMIFETGGATGAPKRTAYTGADFHAAFVAPFVAAARHVGWPDGLRWLWIGPSGPHVIGQAARALPVALGGPEPFCVDFDPRWARKLPEGSFARRRYLNHVLEQALEVIGHEPVEALFCTPSVIEQLSERLTPAQRSRICAIHYGGQRVTETLMRQVEAAFSGACSRTLHLGGYGNTLMGCCLELVAHGVRAPLYVPHGERLQLMPSENGAVRFSRFDDACMLINMIESDRAEWVRAPADRPSGFAAHGLLDPHRDAGSQSRTDAGLY